MSLGVDRLCRDIEFMINVKPGIYWRVCWAFLTPLLMFVILIYTFVSYETLKFKNQPYPNWATCKFLSILFWLCVSRFRERKNDLILFFFSA